MISHGLEPATVEMTPGLLKAVKGSYTKYKTYLDDEKANKAKEKMATQKQRITADISEIDLQIAAKKETIEHLNTRYNKKCKAAERKQDLKLLSEGIGLKRQADETVAAVELLEKTKNDLQEKKQKLQ